MGPSYGQISETAGYVNHPNEYVILISPAVELLIPYSSASCAWFAPAFSRSSIAILLSRGRTKCLLFLAEPLELAITSQKNDGR